MNKWKNNCAFDRENPVRNESATQYHSTIPDECVNEDMAAVSNLTETHILEKKLMLSALNSSSPERENSMQKLAENSSKRSDPRAHSPGSTSETAAPVLQQRADDELTSLTWLQDSNLLFGTALSQMKVINVSEKKASPAVNSVTSTTIKMEVTKTKSAEVAASPEIESAPSELVEEQELPYSKEKDELIESPHSASPDQDPVPYNPQVHVKSKPPYSFSSLIFMAIEDSCEKALPVKDIYSWVIRHFPYYRGAPTGWKNSVRHNLSLNKCFRKVDKSPTLGKGSLWMVDPTFKPNLLTALNKTPFPSTTRTDHIYVTNVRSALNRNPLDHLNRLKEGTPVSQEESSDGPIQLTSRQVCENGQNSGDVYGKTSPNALQGQTYFNLELQDRPMLLKQVHKDDVDAAAAMLVLKHGPMILQDNPQFHFKSTDSQSTANGCRIGRKRKQCHTELQDPNHVLVSNSPSLDHSYVTATGDGGDAKKQKTSDGGKEPSSSSNMRLTKEHWIENNKKHAPLYEANALLKLASIATSLASTDIHQNMSYFNGCLTDSEVLPSDAVRLNDTSAHRASQSSVVGTPLKIPSRKKKNLHPVKRVLNNEIKKFSNNNSCTILNKNNLGRIDYRA